MVAERWLWIGRYAMLLLLFLLIYALILNPVKKRLLESFEHAGQLTPAFAGGGGTAAMIPGVGTAMPASLAPKTDLELEQELNQTNSEVERVVKMKHHLAEKVKSEPAAASQLVKHWLNER
jgi:flagellar biosynthesis/type III secretory pathway M-ring protein FliF/YscJ